MEWETPSFSEIDMSSEIGSYQEEDDPGRREDFHLQAGAPKLASNKSDS